MAFAINFVGDEFEEDGLRLHRLVLTIDDFSEEMYADVTNWSTADYQRQWLNELNTLMSEQAHGALLTSIHDPKLGYRVETWPMWRENNVIYFQNRIIGMIEAERKFDPARMGELIGLRRETDDEGQTVSQWVIASTEIETFLNREVIA